MKRKKKFSTEKLEKMIVGSQQYGDQLGRLIANGQLSKDVLK